MKKQIATAFVLLLILFACKEQFIKTPVNEFTTASGDEITPNEAERWIARYSKLQSAARIQGSGYNISAGQLDEMLNTNNLLGIAFHHGLDGQGTHHIMAVPIDNLMGSLWDHDKYIVDANTNNKINLEVGKEWALNYNASHHGEITYHRFGSEIINEMKSLPFFQDFDIQPGINDEMDPQLILIVKDESNTPGGRVSGNGSSYYDKSNPGPPNP